MILMLIKEESSLRTDLQNQLKSYGINVVHYISPIKALDNIKEIQPRIILYDYQDYPRHWKILIKYLRNEYPKDHIVFLLFTQRRPPLEEANKALYLGINGLLNFDGNHTTLAKNIREVFLRHGTFDIAQEKDDWNSYQRWGVIFQHPYKKHLVTGSFVYLDQEFATFKPDFVHEINDLSTGDVISHCSLRLQENLLILNANVIKNTGQLHLKIQVKDTADLKFFQKHLQTQSY